METEQTPPAKTWAFNKTWTIIGSVILTISVMLLVLSFLDRPGTKEEPPRVDTEVSSSSKMTRYSAYAVKVISPGNESPWVSCDPPVKIDIEGSRMDIWSVKQWSLTSKPGKESGKRVDNNPYYRDATFFECTDQNGSDCHFFVALWSDDGAPIFGVIWASPENRAIIYKISAK